jgi:hypothetical protein
MIAPPREDLLAITLEYHEQTKHHPERYARSLGYRRISTWRSLCIASPTWNPAFIFGCAI